MNHPSIRRRAPRPAPGFLSRTALCAALALIAWGPLASSAIAAELPVQGTLRTLAGGPVPDGGYVVVVSLYDADKAAKPLWEELHKSVKVERGLFRLRAGAVKPIADALLESGKPLWIGLSVAGGDELPRVAIRPVVSAWHARLAARALLADKAKHADTAASAEKADRAKEAEHAAKADLAVQAQRAQQATSAQTAATAKKALNADKAAVAQTALSAKGLSCTGCVGPGQLSDQVATSRVALLEVAKQPCDGAGAGRVGFSAKDGRMWLCTGKAWRRIKLCGDACLPAGTVACGQPIPDDCGDAGSCPGKGTRCSAGSCVGGKCVLPGTSKELPARSCRAILTANASAKSGIYWLAPGGPGSPAFRARCDMETDGGGWTLVAYLGTIKTNKATTAGSKAFMPLFDDFGSYDPEAPSSRAAFSRLDLFLPLFKDSSRLLARRTSVPAKMMSWPVASASSWRTKRILPPISWLRMTIDGKNWGQRTKNLTVFQPKPAPAYTGYNWNTPATENCDHCGRSFSTALNHRSLLYWERNDGGYSASQWWHASPLSLKDSTSPDNGVQDVEIWLREAGGAGS